MKLEVNIGKRYFFIFLAIGLIIVGIVGVIAYVSPPDWTKYPSDFGHSVDEIDWGQTINANLSVNGNVNVIGNVTASWVCIGADCRNVWPIAAIGGVSKITAGNGITISPLSGTGEVTISAISGGTIGGSGIVNYIPKFTSGTALGNSVIFESGGNVGIGTASPSAAKLTVAGRIRATEGTEIYRVDNGYCANAGALTTSGACTTTPDLWGYYYFCGGSGGAYSPQSCPNALIGRLVDA